MNSSSITLVCQALKLKSLLTTYDSIYGEMEQMAVSCLFSVIV